MDKDRIAAIAARAEKIKMNRAEYLWIYCANRRRCRTSRLPSIPTSIPNICKCTCIW
jgi:hypothetical protein